MDIKFADKKLEKYANDDKLSVRKQGSKRADLYKTRLDDMWAAETYEDLRNLPGRYHELINQRKGQWACDLDHPYRLIFTTQERPIPTDIDGKYIWLEISSVEIIEIENYHKEG
jgi:proteic killer suppression protein